MHYSTKIDDLKIEIENYGHKVVNIVNMRHRITKQPLSMFSIDLQLDENNKSIYSVEYLLQTKIKFEAPYLKREIPQCTNCQQYGHTKNFCSRLLRCVKCTSSHRTADCKITGRSNQVKCVLYGGNYPVKQRLLNV